MDLTTKKEILAAKFWKQQMVRVSSSVITKRNELRNEFFIVFLGKGANVVLDCVGANYWQQNLDCISFDGTWVLYGLLSKFQSCVYLSWSTMYW